MRAVRAPPARGPTAAARPPEQATCPGRPPRGEQLDRLAKPRGSRSPRRTIGAGRPPRAGGRGDEKRRPAAPRVSAPARGPPRTGARPPGPRMVAGLPRAWEPGSRRTGTRRTSSRSIIR